MHLCPYAPTHLYTYAPIHLRTYAPTHLCAYAPMHLRTYAPMHLCTYAPTHLCTYAPTHLCTYAPTHLRTHAPALSQHNPLFDFQISVYQFCGEFIGGGIHHQNASLRERGGGFATIFQHLGSHSAGIDRPGLCQFLVSGMK